MNQNIYLDTDLMELPSNARPSVKHSSFISSELKVQ